MILNYLRLSIVLILSVTQICVAQEEKPVANPYYLQLFGVVKEITMVDGQTKTAKLVGATVEIFNSNNKLVYSEAYDGKKRIAIKLALNENYTVKISHEGFVSKSFLVNTIVAKQKSSVYNFPFEVTLFKKIPNLDIVLNDPVAIVQFFSKESKFDYDYEYTEEINAELREKYHNYYLESKEEQQN